MKNARLFRLLIVEDEPNWGERLDALAKARDEFGSVHWAKTRDDALDKIGGHHYHFVSTDQNIPDAPREIITPDSGLRLCREIVETNRFTNRSVYTAYGAKLFANQIGHLDNTTYYEKRTSDNANEGEVESLDAVQYIDRVANDLNENYLQWSMVRAGRHLPRAFGAAAEQLGERWGYKDRPSVVRLLNDLRERALELAWAQTAALARQARRKLPDSPSRTDLFKPADKEADIAALWPVLYTAGLMGPWWKFLSAETCIKDNNSEMRVNFPTLSLLRDGAHDRFPEPVETDLTSQMASILPLIDLLAGWAEMPLIESVRRHPQRRDVIQFNILAGAPPWKLGEAADVFSDIPSSPHIFLRWRQAESPFLLDLHPFVLRARIGLRHEPHVFCCARYDRAGKLAVAVYRSLVSGDTSEFEVSGHGDLLAELGPLLARS